MISTSPAWRATNIVNEQLLLMKERLTRSTTDFSHTKLDNSQYIPPSKNNNRGKMSDSQTSNVTSQNERQFAELKLDEDVQQVGGHVLNDQPAQLQMSHHEFIKINLQTFQKFSGVGDVKKWLTNLLEKFDVLGVDMDDRIKLIPGVLTGEAFIWYAKQEQDTLSFTSFTRLFLKRFSTKLLEGEKVSLDELRLYQQQSITTSGLQADVFNQFRTQFLFNHLQELPKFAGKSKQHVSKWLREINQAIHMFTLTDDEKLSFIFLCLEGDARDWYFDNNHLFSTWSSFIQKLINTFEPSGKAAISSSVFIPIQNQQQLEKSSVILENHDKLYDTKKTLIPEISTSHVIVDKSAPAISLNTVIESTSTVIESTSTVIESTSTVIESVTHNPGKNDFEQQSEMNQLTVQIQQEKLHSAGTSETSFIQKQKLKPKINHDGTLDNIRSEKFPIIFGKVNLEVKQTLRLANTSIQIVLYKLICEAHNQMIIQINTILIEILLIVNIYNSKILKIYRFMAPKYDPGGKGGNVWSDYTYFIVIMGGFQHMSDYVGLNF